MARITCLHGHEIEVQPAQLGERIACPACQLLMFLSPPRANEPIIPKYEVLCEQGHVLRVKSKYLGTQIRCPQCQGLAWVTTDRLQRLQPSAPSIPVVPVVAVAPPPAVPVRRAVPVAAASLAPRPAAPTLVEEDDIPIAEVDHAYMSQLAAKARVVSAKSEDDDAEEEVDSTELTKAERRSMKLADQGLSYFTGTVVGFCSIQMVGTVLSFILFLIMQGISSMSGFQTLSTISEVIGWIMFIGLVLNTVAFLAAIVLTMFTPWVTGATLWFMMSLVTMLGFLGWRLFLVIKANEWKALPAVFALTGSTFGESKLYYFIGEALFIFQWVFLMVALWQLGKFARKPMTRQRVILLIIMGLASWSVMTLYPLLGEMITASKVAAWVLLIFRVLLTIGIGILMILQHLTVVNDVRAVVARRK